MELHIPQRLVSATPVTLKIHPPILVITYTQVANVSPLPILKGRVTTMEKTKSEGEEPVSSSTCMHASHRFTCLRHTPTRQEQ